MQLILILRAKLINTFIYNLLDNNENVKYLRR